MGFSSNRLGVNRGIAMLAREANRKVILVVFFALKNSACCSHLVSTLNGIARKISKYFKMRIVLSIFSFSLGLGLILFCTYLLLFDLPEYGKNNEKTKKTTTANKNHQPRRQTKVNANFKKRIKMRGGGDEISCRDISNPRTAPEHN